MVEIIDSKRCAEIAGTYFQTGKKFEALAFYNEAKISLVRKKIITPNLLNEKIVELKKEVYG